MRNKRRTHSPALPVTFRDLRKNARIYGSFPVRLRGTDTSGCAFHASSLVDNIGARGLYLELNRPVVEGSGMFAVVWLISGATIAAKGLVTRVEDRPHGLSGIAMRFTRTRLLPPVVVKDPAEQFTELEQLAN